MQVIIDALCVIVLAIVFLFMLLICIAPFWAIRKWDDISEQQWNEFEQKENADE